jgi:endoribonuclease Nob1
LDTSAFLAGFDPFSSGQEQITAPKVEDEIRANSMAWLRFQTAIESGRVKIVAPTDQYSNQAKSCASKVGDSYLLSETDMQLLSLALEYKAKGYTPQIITDDYSIQNVATQMGIGFTALATFGIKRLLEWMRYCPACHKEYPANSKFSECQVCGTELKRKPKRNTKQTRV